MESAEGLSDIELTWFEAASALPSAVTKDVTVERITDPARRKALGDLQDRKLSVVIYLHGCTGLSSNDRDVMKALAKAGYAVIAPDSMARRYRPQQCASWNKSGGYNLFVFDFRQAEINFAVQQMFEQPWVDWDNLFLVGVSEGALAVAHHRGPAFRARVITQWTCHGSTHVEGIDGPEDTPILSVVRRNDPWYDGKDSKQSGDCGAFFGSRPGSISMVLDEGKSHNVMDEPEVIQAIIHFLDQNRKR
ncbi:MAG: dienelactone hydrolase family protein [Proteobacteria bacterium]|nr:dienelactone hydrolase family protein [Pseudomonadota bacterium]